MLRRDNGGNRLREGGKERERERGGGREADTVCEGNMEMNEGWLIFHQSRKYLFISRAKVH